MFLTRRLFCRPSPVVASNATKNMPGIVAQALSAAGKTVEVQQPSGDWVRMTIMGSVDKPGGGVVMVSTSTGEKKQLQQADEGRTYNIRLV